MNNNLMAAIGVISFIAILVISRYLWIRFLLRKKDDANVEVDE